LFIGGVHGNVCVIDGGYFYKWVQFYVYVKLNKRFGTYFITTMSKNTKNFFAKRFPYQPNKKGKMGGVLLEPTTFMTDEYRATIRAHSHLGKKGYTIPKEFLVKDDLDFLYKDLYCKPSAFGPAAAAAAAEAAFPVYRENTKKIYIPRFYGIDRYGPPAKSEVDNLGESIDVPFEKSLRDYQDNIVGIYMNHVSNLGQALGKPLGQALDAKASLEQALGKPLGQALDAKASLGQALGKPLGGGILEVPCGRGKTVMGLKIISLLGKKTLIIVHKEFLMNQWIERIQEFLPTAKIGKIQGTTFDVAGKDIVIGMLQSLYDREFEPGAFDPFGLTLIDEVHRIGSEQFSKTLLRIVTPCMLGLSATVERKDGLTKILYMFIGPKIYTESRKDEDVVSVRAIEYVSGDADFLEPILDFRGNTLYSSMITKLCAFGPRCDFIVRVVADLVAESPDSQIMILAHNRSLLTYLYEAITYRGFAAAGFYVGGMKQRDLTETESKQIVLATYAMAAEALDIKTLSTLVMVTPKTDITQSVGRILRTRHDNPIVVDIVDPHDIFQNQWRQRKTFYKKCNYRIRSIRSTHYGGMQINWANDKTWFHVFDPKGVTGAQSKGVTDIDPKSDAGVCHSAESKYSSTSTTMKGGLGKCMIQLSEEELEAVED
jgi:Type III restriction enzyme, res subunit